MSHWCLCLLGCLQHMHLFFRVLVVENVSFPGIDLVEEKMSKECHIILFYAQKQTENARLHTRTLVKSAPSQSVGLN